MEEIKHYDILWVDDFDQSPKSVKDYFPKEFGFRVKIESNFFNALVDLENNFTNYSCVVLDVNFINGFNVNEVKDEAGLKSKKIRFENGDIEEFDEIEDEQETNTVKESVILYRLYNILKNNNILIDIASNAENFFDDEVIDFEKSKKIVEAFNVNDNFKKNAGYYLFLYLLQRGMPQKNIAMLTGNKGETSKEWDKKFKEANFQSPKAFDRNQCELTRRKKTSEFVAWLNEVFNPPYRLRACMVAMTSLLQKMLNDENIKKALLTSNSIWTEDSKDDRYSTIKNFHPEYIPLSLPREDKKSVEVLFPFIFQVIIPWDKSTFHENGDKYPYVATMRTARNWLAHRNIQISALQTECFLFGICMRGLFNLSILKPETLREYEKWEDELLQLIEKLDADFSLYVDEIFDLVIPSSEEILTRSKIKSNSIHKVLDSIGWSKKSINCYEEDLLRGFLHGVYGDIPAGRISDGLKGLADHKIQIRYLDAVKNRLKKAIDEAKKCGCNS